MTEAAHDDVVRGPWADPAQREEAIARDGRVDTGMEFDDAVGDGSGETPNGVASRSRHRERRVGRLGELVRSREAREPRIAGIDRADRRDDPRGDGPRTGHRHLLADDGADGGLERIDAGRRPTAGHRVRRVVGVGESPERVVDRRRVGVEIEESPDPLHGGAEVDPRLEREPRRHVVVMGDEFDMAVDRRADRAPVRTTAPSHDSRPGMARSPRNRHHLVAANGCAPGA